MTTDSREALSPTDTGAASRVERLERFLEVAGWSMAARTALPADASFRSYQRLDDGAGTAILMDAPPPQEDVRSFLAIARLLGRLDLSAPKIIAEDLDSGLLLLEDLGEESFTRVLAERPHEEAALYALATDTIVALQKRFSAEMAPDLPAYDVERLLAEARLLVEWYIPAAEGAALPEAALAAYDDAWRQAFTALRGTPGTLVLRDFHVDNLIWLPERPGERACGLLDFQDAVLGSPAYDLLSLLEDARRDLPEELRETMLTRYLAAFPEQNEAAFRAAYRVLGAQRHAKVIGIFTRLWKRDGKARYLAHLPRLWRLLGRALADPALAPVAGWFDEHLPPARRRPLSEAAA